MGKGNRSRGSELGDSAIIFTLADHGVSLLPESYSHPSVLSAPPISHTVYFLFPFFLPHAQSKQKLERAPGSVHAAYVQQCFSILLTF